ncbi:hypothetical protein [Segetibacter aerophilus]|uniref:hypothetical protein n=1 Tax=Segetibacter aerophilus TaxID=670293 RepID=UPI0011BDF316|nr:hypothetical protein [Segetibacter aerophilus]
MKKPHLLLVLLSIALFYSSCTKERLSLTQAELTAGEIQNVINSQQLKRVVAVAYNETFPNSFPSSVGTTFSFSNGFITISGYSRSFNLTYLKAYEVANVVISDNNPSSPTSSRTLVLHFQ